MSQSVTLVGIDCATDPRKVGLALGEWYGEGVSVRAAELGESREGLARRVAGWLPSRGPALLALDAPLGWPGALGQALADHRAGQPVEGDPQHLFRRETDRAVRERVGLQPLDVGADRIARTAVAALRLLAELRELTGHGVPLAWTPRIGDEPAAIEVYPAATLTVHGLRSRGYKATRQSAERAEILEGLRERSVRVDDPLEPLLVDRADALDAVVCLLAGADFLSGRAPGPRDAEESRREGWIWVGRTDA